MVPTATSTSAGLLDENGTCSAIRGWPGSLPGTNGPANRDRREWRLPPARPCFEMTVPGQPPSNPQPDGAWLRLSVAPMMDWTDTHCRVFHRLLAPHARLYTEMVHANAVIHGDRDRLLAMDPVEHPVALQLGGSEPALLAQAAR